MSSKKRNPIYIVGPTASGKTALAVALAKHYDGEIINADSMQVYRELDIGSAKPTQAERQGVPHHLLDVVSVGEAFSVSAYRTLANKAMEEIQFRGHVPIICGGTGLYFQALTGMLQFSETKGDPAIRLDLQAFADRHGKEALFKRLQEADPVTAARLHPNDVKRVVRALEVYQLTGKPFSEQNTGFQNNAYTENQVCAIGLQWERHVLNERIDRRVDAMIQDGLIEEARQIWAKGIPQDHPSMMGLGYRQLFAYFAGKYTLEQAIEAIKRETHRFAKRQMTWFLRDLRIQWLQPQQYATPALLVQAAQVRIDGYKDKEEEK